MARARDPRDGRGLRVPHSSTLRACSHAVSRWMVSGLIAFFFKMEMTANPWQGPGIAPRRGPCLAYERPAANCNPPTGAPRDWRLSQCSAKHKHRPTRWGPRALRPPRPPLPGPRGCHPHSQGQQALPGAPDGITGEFYLIFKAEIIPLPHKILWRIQ